ITKPISSASPFSFLSTSFSTIAFAALALFQTLRGAIVSPKTKPATFAASGESKTFASCWAAISLGVMWASRALLFVLCSLLLELLTKNKEQSSKHKVLFVLRHYFLAAAKYVSHHSLLRYRKELQSISAPLLDLLHLYCIHFRQMPFCP